MQCCSNMQLGPFVRIISIQMPVVFKTIFHWRPLCKVVDNLLIDTSKQLLHTSVQAEDYANINGRGILWPQRTKNFFHNKKRIHTIPWPEEEGTYCGEENNLVQISPEEWLLRYCFIPNKVGEH